MSKPKPGFWRRLGRGVAGLFGGGSQPKGRRYYDAATPSRAREWSTKSGGPNAVVGSVGLKLRDRARDMDRNDAHIARAHSVEVNNLFGSGITATAVGGPEGSPAARRAAAADAAWAEWGKRGVADVEGRHTRDALIALIVKAAKVSGDGLIQRIADRDAPLAWRLRVMEGDMLDESKNGPLPEGGRITQGVEQSPMGRVVAYWIRKGHPGENWPLVGALSTDSVRVPAEDIIHFFIPLRPGQLRGIPMSAPVLATKRDLADLNHFELVRRKVETSVAGFIIPGDDLEESHVSPDDDGNISPGAYDSDGNIVEDIQPGLLATLRGGKDIRFHTPMAAGGHVEQAKHYLHDVAVGLGLSYEQLTGDLSGANYSSLRAGLLEFWRRIESEQWLWLIPTVMDRLWDWCMAGAYIKGLIDTPEVPVEWSPPKRASVDPSKDILADYLKVRGGFAPWSDVVAENGYTAARMSELLAAERALWDLHDLTLDVDSRKYAWRGAAPPNTPQAAPPAEGNDDGET